MANISTQGFGHIILTVNEDCTPNNISSKQNYIYNRSHDMAGERFKLSKLCKSPWLRWYNYVKPVWGSKNWWLTPNHRPHPPGAPRWEQVDLHDPARVSTALLATTLYCLLELLAVLLGQIPEGSQALDLKGRAPDVDSPEPAQHFPMPTPRAIGVLKKCSAMQGPGEGTR